MKLFIFYLIIGKDKVTLLNDLKSSNESYRWRLSQCRKALMSSSDTIKTLKTNNTLIRNELDRMIAENNNLKSQLPK